MRAPAFWQGGRSGPATGLSARLPAMLLAPVARLYGGVTAWRMGRPVERAALPVVCIGNFTVGGTGKTPAALAIAALLEEIGERPAFLTRGHGGRLRGPVEVDPQQHGHTLVGDEPLLLARGAPVIVSRDRPTGANEAGQIGASVIVMDDGFQNPSLAKDLSLILVDGAVGVMNGMCLPAGPLRAPLARQWEHADALIVMGKGAPGDALADEARARGLPVFRARLEPDAQAVAALRARRCLAFAGIGRPQKFFDTLAEVGIDIADSVTFPDHHSYRPQDITRLQERAAQGGLTLVTTEKDAVRLPELDDLAVLPVTALFDDAPALLALLRRAIRDA